MHSELFSQHLPLNPETIAIRGLLMPMWEDIQQQMGIATLEQTRHMVMLYFQEYVRPGHLLLLSDGLGTTTSHLFLTEMREFSAPKRDAGLVGTQVVTRDALGRFRVGRFRVDLERVIDIRSALKLLRPEYLFVSGKP